jgi:hypothetical protein
MVTPIFTSEDASSHGTPVYITVWDLSPPTALASAAYGLFGLGIFHTNVWLPDLSVEWAFGGHGYAGVSGIFSLPRDPTMIGAIQARVEASPYAALPSVRPVPSTLDGMSVLAPECIPAPGPSPIPHARYVGSYFIGYAGEPVAAAPGGPAETFPYRRWASAQSGRRAFREPDCHVDPYYRYAAEVLVRSGAAGRADGVRCPSSALPSAAPRCRHPRHSGQRLAAVAYATKTLQALCKDLTWTGPRYDLLARNCNHFTDLVCTTLVGAHVPAWINRSAYLGQNVVWAIPKSILHIETSIPLEADASSTDEEPQNNSPAQQHDSLRRRLHDEVHSADI